MPISVQGWAKKWIPGLVVFVHAVAYNFCFSLPENSLQPGDHFLAWPCSFFINIHKIVESDIFCFNQVKKFRYHVKFKNHYLNGHQSPLSWPRNSMYGLYGTVNLKVGASDLPSPVKKFDHNQKEVGQKRNKVRRITHKYIQVLFAGPVQREEAQKVGCNDLVR